MGKSSASTLPLLQKNRLKTSSSPGLTHTTLSGITIGEKQAVVMELRGQGNVITYKDCLCPDLTFQEII